MNKLFPLVLAGCCVLHTALAQVSVEIVLAQDKFLPGEDLLAGVRVVNRSGQTLKLGAEADWIQFTIERDQGGFVPKLSDPPVKRPFDLESTQQGTLKVNLAPCFDLRKVGNYQIAAEVKIKDWSTTLTTKPVRFEVIEGTKLWEQEFGVPSSISNAPPEIRRYTLQQANYLDEPRLYLRVSEARGQVIKLINIGRMLSFGRPEPRLDKNNRLHLLHQNGARSSDYLVFNPEGEIEIRQTYEYGASRPRLRLDAKGVVVVDGGVRRVSPTNAPIKSESKIDADNKQADQ